MKKITLINQLQPQYTNAGLVANDFITCIADSHWWTGHIMVVSQEDGNIT